jgi:hypothetical protein
MSSANPKDLTKNFNGVNLNGGNGSSGDSTGGKISLVGLKSPGVILLQLLLILTTASIDQAVGQIGAATGIALVLAFIGGILLGRSGTLYAAIVSPPLIALFATLFASSVIGGDGLHITRLAVHLISSLGALAPYLVVGSIASWAYYYFKLS